MSQNKITETLRVEMRPFASIIAYDTEIGVCYLEARKIDENGKMGAGKPLTDAFLAKIVKVLVTNTKEIDTSIHGMIPPNVLYCDTRIDNEKLVWYRQREKRFLYFSESAEMPNGMVEIPPMVYCAERGKGLSVHCFKGSKPKNKLYRAPFYNTSDKYVCLGSAKKAYPNEHTFENIMQYWEDLYWKSEFVHLLDGNPVNGNLSTILKDCISNGLPFPEDRLVESKYKLKDLLK